MSFLQRKIFYFLAIILVLQLLGCTYFSNVSRAKRYIERGKNKQAISILTKEISKKTNDYLPYFYRGSAYAEVKKYSKAISDYSKCIELKPDFYYAYYNRSLVFNEIKKYELALDDLNKVVALKPDFYYAFVQRGILYEKLKENQKAMLNFDKALSLQPKGLFALLFKAHLLYNMGNYKEAMSYYDVLIELYSSESAIVCNDIAWRLIMCPKKEYRNINVAFSLAKKAYKIFPCFLTCDTLAAVYAAKKDFNNAMKYQKEAIKLALKEHGNNENEFVPELSERLQSYKRKIPWEEGVGKSRKGVITQGGVIRSY